MLSNPEQCSVEALRQLNAWATLVVNLALVAFCAPAYKMLIMRQNGKSNMEKGAREAGGRRAWRKRLRRRWG